MMRFSRTLLASCAALFAAAGLSQAASVTVASGVSPGIKALQATNTTTFYGGGSCTEFATFVDNTFFSAANAAPAAVTLGTPLPGSWNNSGNTATGWTGANSAAMDAAGARWIHSNSNNASGGSVLYAIPFFVPAGLPTANITLDFVTDNGLGNTLGANGQGPHAGFTNNGLFLNGLAGDLGYSSPLVGSGNPAQFGSITHLSYSNLSVIPNATNYLYFYQFNWGGPGGSAFTVNVEMIPLPTSAGMGLVGLALVGVRRRRA